MADSVIGRLRVILGIDSNPFKAGLSDARAAVVRAGQSMQSIGKTLSLAVTAPMIAFGGLTIRAAGDFEASMNRVGAATGATGKELGALRDMARHMGATTQFSATEAADAIEVLAKNGLSASDILGGALSASMLLAASSGAELADAGDIATDVMLQFGKKAGDLGGVVDGITGTLLASKFGIDDYRQALAQAGGVAGGLGVEFDDFNAAIGATSSLFDSGSDAGTSFKTFLQRLVPNTKDAAEWMKHLGLSFYDATGNLKPMNEVAQQLKVGLAGLSEEAKTEALTTMFGTDAMRTAIGLMNAGAEGIDKISASIDKASAKDQAAARMEGFNGAVKELSSAFEALQLAIADSGLLTFVTDMVKALTGIIQKVSEADPQILRLGTIFAAVAAAIGPVLVALGLVVTAVAAIGAPIALAVIAVGAITAALIAFWPEIIKAKDAVIEWGAGVQQWLADLPAQIPALFAALPGQMMQIGRDILGGLWNGLVEKFQGVKDGIADFAGGLVDGVRARLGIKSPSTVFREIGANIMQGLGIGLKTTGTEVQTTMEGVTSGLSQNIKTLFDGVLFQGQSFGSALKSVLGNALSSTASRIGSAGVDALVKAIIPGFANGTGYAPGGLAWVGEHGRELVNLPRGSQVIPNHALNEMAGSGGRNGSDPVRAHIEVSVRNDGSLAAFVRQESASTAGAMIATNNRNLVETQRRRQ